MLKRTGFCQPLLLIGIVFAALFLFSPFYFALALGVVVTLGVWEWT